MRNKTCGNNDYEWPRMTSNSQECEPQDLPDTLIKLGTFKWPRSEARQTLGHLFEKVKIGLLPDVGENAVDVQELKSISDDALNRSVRMLLATRLHNMLDHHYLEWAQVAENAVARRAFVHPPMNEDTLTDWADHHGLPVLHCDGNLHDFGDAACILIPQLETFFARDHNKLAPLFDLFSDLAGFKGKVLVGCNSWAWRYLKQFDDALLLFGNADTFPAFDKNALAAILEGALSHNGKRDTFSSVESGNSILARDDDDGLTDPYLENLAGRSLGLPWVAIEMFFRGIAETKDKEKASDAGRIWVDLPAACSLPANGSDALLFALHALMIHGSRSIDALNDLLPQRVPNGIWTELNRTGFINLQDDRVQCAIRSYPDIRSELGAAGFNLDEL